MAAGPETSTPPGAKQVLGPDDVRRVITRMAHEIIERNHGTDRVALIGIQQGGGWLGGSTRRGDHPDRHLVGSPCRSARSTPASTATTSGCVPFRLAVSDLRFDVNGITVVLVDDVLYTGRTVRAALAAVARRDLAVGVHADLVAGGRAGEEVVDLDRVPVAVELAAGAEDARLAVAHAGEGGHRERRGRAVLVGEVDHLVVDDVVVAGVHAAPVRALGRAPA